MVELSRDVVATTIPYGQKTKLPKGTNVTITQDLGGSLTVLSDIGMMRIEGADAEALGLEARRPEQPVQTGEPLDLKETVTRVWDALKTCYDPEIPVNIVELGLIYENKVEPHPEGGWNVKVQMTLTAPGCGMGTVLQAEARDKIVQIPGIRECTVDLVWDPPWDQSRMSDAAKLQLGMM